LVIIIHYHALFSSSAPTLVTEFPASVGTSSISPLAPSDRAGSTGGGRTTL
jgi:hypothetical protein